MLPDTALGHRFIPNEALIQFQLCFSPTGQSEKHESRFSACVVRDFKLRPFRFESQSHQKPQSPCLCGFSLDRVEKSLPDGISCVESLAALADLGLLKATSFQQCELKMRFVGSFHSCLHLMLRPRENHPMTTQLWLQRRSFQRCVVQVVSNCVWFRPLCILPFINKFSIIYMSLGCTCNRDRSLPT